MCKAKVDGGQRCVGCLTKTETQRLTTLNMKREQLKRLVKEGATTAQARWKIKKLQETIFNKTNAYEKSVEARKKREEEVRSAHAETSREKEAKQKSAEEDRKKETARREAEWQKKGVPSQVGLGLTDTEWNSIKDEAEELQMSASEYVETIIHAPLNLHLGSAWKIRPVEIGERREKSSHGRIPTVSKTLRTTRPIRLKSESIARITATAEALGLTRSDYLRRKINGIDVRSAEIHESETSANIRLEKLRQIETAGGLNADASPEELEECYRGYLDNFVKENGTVEKLKARYQNRFNKN